MNMRERIKDAIGRGIDIADPLVGGVIEQSDLYAAADAVLDALMEPDEGMIEAALQARCTVDGVHWSDGLTEGVARVEHMLMETAIKAAITAARSGRSGER